MSAFMDDCRFIRTVEKLNDVGVSVVGALVIAAFLEILLYSVLCAICDSLAVAFYSGII